MAIRPLLVGLVCVVVACAPGGAPTSPADITGTITRATAGSVLVEERPADTAGSLKAAVRLTSATTVWKVSGGSQHAATRADLREGLRVSVWFDGPVLTSYPVQAGAKAILILEAGPS